MKKNTASIFQRTFAKLLVMPLKTDSVDQVKYPGNFCTLLLQKVMKGLIVSKQACKQYQWLQFQTWF